uniref:Disaggregatase-related domain-containing protein n=1 Tax=uncultured Planctomycetota bacterium TaxID=120965 RepID=A0A5B8KE02_9BACT|nr:hypothetical protein fos2004AM_00018 [uncultured Planctomycetota bacterium]
MKLFAQTLLLVAVSCAAVLTVQADTVVLDPQADNWINSCSNGCTVNNGDNVYLRVRTSWWGNPREVKNFRTLLQFDLSALPTDPALIKDATLGLYYYQWAHGDPAGRTYNVYRLVNSWDETTSTWQARYDDGLKDVIYWDSYWAGEPAYKPGGGDFDEMVYAEAVVPASTDEWMTWDVTGLLKEWVGGDYANDGLIIADADEIESDPGTGAVSLHAHFRSREYSNSAYWPYLEVETRDFPLGDMNCDGTLSFLDIDPFVLAIDSRDDYEAEYPDCDYYNADCNEDGTVSFLDIDPFVELLDG